jgi:hypothetical protein
MAFIVFCYVLMFGFALYLLFKYKEYREKSEMLVSMLKEMECKIEGLIKENRDESL